ncbi:UDP-N-acetylglucosamine 2-epimerase, partial [Yeosuana marina]|uniref:UDP-N-acetylglucosamine 2-epimerase n=1 Tax=Yeosuana marina TaxID=1565536 RepID=UPI0030C86D6B
GGVGNKIEWEKEYIVVMQHPVTNEYKESRENVYKTLKAVHVLGIPTFWFWPNVDSGADGTSKGIRSYREEHQPDNIHFFKNMTPEDFLRLLCNSKCLVGNSSVGIRECAFLGVPVVNIGTRQHGRLRGNNVLDVAYDEIAIKNGILNRLETLNEVTQSNIYGNGKSGEKMADILANIELRYHKTIAY